MSPFCSQDCQCSYVPTCWTSLRDQVQSLGWRVLSEYEVQTKCSTGALCITLPSSYERACLLQVDYGGGEIIFFLRITANEWCLWENWRKPDENLNQRKPMPFRRAMCWTGSMSVLCVSVTYRSFQSSAHHSCIHPSIHLQLRLYRKLVTILEVLQFPTVKH